MPPAGYSGFKRHEQKEKWGTILVDTDTAKENVARATLAQGWQVAGILGREDGYEILVKKED